MTSGTPTRMAAWLESAWLARYLDRQLEGEELAWFEAYLLDKPELVGAVEVDTGLRDALWGEQPTCIGDVPPSSRVESQLRARLQMKVLLMTAASLLLGVGVGVIGERFAVSTITGPEAEWIANPTRAVFDTLRGDEQQAPQVERPASRSAYVLVEVAVPAGAENVELEADFGHHIALSPSSEGFVSFLVLRDAIKPSGLAIIRYSLDGKLRSREIRLYELH